MHKTFGLVIASAVAAFAVPATTSFKMYLEREGTLLSLVATNNGTSDLIIAAQRPSVYVPDEANLVGVSPNASVELNLTASTTVTPGIYGLSVPDVGDNYGIALDVIARLNYEEPEFGINNATLFHKLYSAENTWLSCLDTVNGESTIVLKFGVFQTDGSAPVNCETTSVHVVYDV